MADATATTDSPYDVKVEDLGGARKRLSITVPADVIAERVETSMGTLLGEAQLPGFRKGRAPKALIERRFGESVRQETKNQIVADAYSKSIEAHGIKPIGEPMPVDDLSALEVKAGESMSFQLDVEVVPEFDLPKLEGLAIDKPVIQVTDEHIESEVEKQCIQGGELISVDGGFVEGDRLLGPGKATRKGEDEPFFEHENVDLVVPPKGEAEKGHVLGLLVNDLDKLVAGKKIGDALHIETKGPESHEREDVRGQDLVIEMTIREGQRIQRASIDDIVTRYGFASEDVLREQVKFALEQRRDEEQRAAMREQVYEQLNDAVDFEVPERMSEQQAAQILERQRLDMLYRGNLSADEVETQLAQLRAETMAESRKRLKLFFLLHRLGDHFEVSVTEQEINGRIAAMATQRGMRPEKLKQELLQSGAINQIASQIREHKAADRVIDQATVTEISAKDWNTRVEAKRGGSSKKTTTKKKTTKKKTTKKTSSKSE